MASFVMTALRHEPIVESTYRQAAEVLGAETLIELVVLVGYYEALATLLTVFDVAAPDFALGRKGGSGGPWRLSWPWRWAVSSGGSLRPGAPARAWPVRPP